MNRPEVVEIPILLEDIEQGTSHNVRSCPIALAANRLLPGPGFWSVGQVTATKHESRNTPYSLGLAAQKFIKDFDRGEDVAPQTVALYHSSGSVLQYIDQP